MYPLCVRPYVKYFKLIIPYNSHKKPFEVNTISHIWQMRKWNERGVEPPALGPRRQRWSHETSLLLCQKELCRVLGAPPPPEPSSGMGRGTTPRDMLVLVSNVVPRDPALESLHLR